MTATEGLTHYLEIVKEELDKSHPGIDLSRCVSLINDDEGLEWTHESSLGLARGVNLILSDVLEKKGLTRKEVQRILLKAYGRMEWPDPR